LWLASSTCYWLLARRSAGREESQLAVAVTPILGQDEGVSQSTVNLLQGPADEVRRVKALLKSHGIESTLGEPPEGCGSG